MPRGAKEEVSLSRERATNDLLTTQGGFKREQRAARSDAVRKAGLVQDLAIANRYFGDLTTKLTGPSVGVPEPIAPERIRAFGRPMFVLGNSSGSR